MDCVCCKLGMRFPALCLPIGLRLAVLFSRVAAPLKLDLFNLQRHPGEGRDPDLANGRRRFATALFGALGPGLRRDDDFEGEGFDSGHPKRAAWATSLQERLRTFYFSPLCGSVAFDPKTPRNRPLPVNDNPRRTCRLCRPCSVRSTLIRASIVARPAPAYLPSVPHPRAAILRTP